MLSEWDEEMLIHKREGENVQRKKILRIKKCSMKDATENNEILEKIPSFIAHIKWHKNQSFPEYILIKLLYNSCYFFRGYRKTVLFYLNQLLVQGGH